MAARPWSSVMTSGRQNSVSGNHSRTRTPGGVPGASEAVRSVRAVSSDGEYGNLPLSGVPVDDGAPAPPTALLTVVNVLLAFVPREVTATTQSRPITCRPTIQLTGIKNHKRR